MVVDVKTGDIIIALSGVVYDFSVYDSFVYVEIRYIANISNLYVPY